VAAAAVALLVGSCRSPVKAPAFDCAYAAQPDGEIADRGPCAYEGAGGRVRIVPARLSQLSYDADGLASVWVRGRGWLYVKRDGETLEVLSEDNGPDPFSEGLVRSMRGGKVAYFDRSFRMVISPRYDFGWPFEGGRALVCLGCRTAPADSEGHRAVLGGLWGYIDRDGREVVPVRSSREDALRSTSSR
jgi:hypothetical protein